MLSRSKLLQVFLEIEEAIRRINRRFSGIQTADDFIKDDDGLDRLDGISMMLISISENIRRIEKLVGQETLESYTEINWRQVKGIRNILAHIYFDIDHEEVHKICATDLPQLKTVLTKMRDELVS